ncbi:MAG: carotenoid biosynthesis protein [Acidimicrobiia bacterium]
MNATASRAAQITMAVGAIVLAGAQIAIPLTSTSPELSSAVVGALGVVAFGAAWWTWGIRTALRLAITIIPLAWAIELLGSRTGVPFGAYEYRAALQPQLLGVPVIVPIAWFGMGLAAFATARALSNRVVVQVILGAGALTAWDIFLDPQMVGAGFWKWNMPGAWTFAGIPLVNYCGWFVAGMMVMVVCARFAGTAVSVPLLGLYTWIAVMQTIGMIAFFDMPLVGACGAIAMGLFWVPAWWRVRNAYREHVASMTTATSAHA